MSDFFGQAHMNKSLCAIGATGHLVSIKGRVLAKNFSGRGRRVVLQLRRLASGSFVHMAAAWWWSVIFCSVGSVVLDGTSHILSFICGVKGLIWLTVPVCALLLLVQWCWLLVQEVQQQQPQPGVTDCMVILIVCEWLLAFLYCGVAYSALVSDLTSTPRGGTCELAADGTACAAGALAAATAVGLVGVLCSQLRQAQAPLQPQA